MIFCVIVYYFVLEIWDTMHVQANRLIGKAPNLNCSWCEIVVGVKVNEWASTLRIDKYVQYNGWRLDFGSHYLSTLSISIKLYLTTLFEHKHLTSLVSRQIFLEGHYLCVIFCAHLIVGITTLTYTSNNETICGVFVIGK